MISYNEKQASFRACRYTIYNIILNILLILLYSVFKTLKWKYMLNLTSFDKTSEKGCSACKSNHGRHDFPCIWWRTSPYLHSIAWVFLSRYDQRTNTEDRWQRGSTQSGTVQRQERMY